MIRVVDTNTTIHETPLEELVFNGRDLVVEFDDNDERRIQLTFSTCQAIKVTTIDCFDVRTLLIDGSLKRHLLEVTNSVWIATLKEELFHHDHSATFLERARHFVLPFQDNIVEVVAWHHSFSGL
jgi:hypothetical protein